MSVTLGDMERLLSAHFARGGEDACGMGETLLRYAAGDASDEERGAFEAHMDGCAFCQTDLVNAGEHATVWDAADEDLAGGWSGSVRAWFSLPRVLVAAAVAALVLVLVLVPISLQEGEEGRLRVKGTWELHVAAERAGQTFRVADGAALRAGDRLGFFYTTERSGFLLILYVDESGEIVRLYPALEENAVQAHPGRKVRVPDGAVLSPGAGCEWIVGLFSGRPVSTEEARGAVRRMLDQREGCGLDVDIAGLKKVDIQVIRVNR